MLDFVTSESGEINEQWSRSKENKKRGITELNELHMHLPLQPSWGKAEIYN